MVHGVKLFRFEGFSMFPFLRPADRLVVKTGTNLPLAVGTVVLFNNDGRSGPGGVVVHRIVRATPEGRFITKGDNMKKPDQRLLSTGDIAGVVVMVLRRRRLKPLTGALARGMARVIAALSRHNLTPALVGTILKKGAWR